MVRHWGASSLAEHVVPAELNANIRLEPGKHELTAEETAAAKADTAATANGYGLLDTGTGSLDKVQVKDGHLVDCDCGEMYALCMFAGKVFPVKGAALTEAE